jgi:copper(I)-binding protein
MNMPAVWLTFATKRSRIFGMRSFLFLALSSLSLATGPIFADKVPVKIEQAWIQAVPPVSDTTAVYMKITNLSAGPLRLISASSPAATSVEPMITTRKTHAGQEVLGMQSVTELLIPAGSSLELKPGGNHLMVMGLKIHPKEGDRVKLTVRFAPGDQKLDLDVPVFKEEPK